jgi:hypothetical protein
VRFALVEGDNAIYERYIYPRSKRNFVKAKEL